MPVFKDLPVGALFRLTSPKVRLNYTYEKVKRSDAYNAEVPGRGLYCVIPDNAVVEVLS
jgi:hypothetical protein